MIPKGIKLSSKQALYVVKIVEGTWIVQLLRDKCKQKGHHYFKKIPGTIVTLKNILQNLGSTAFAIVIITTGIDSFINLDNDISEIEEYFGKIKAGNIWKLFSHYENLGIFVAI